MTQFTDLGLAEPLLRAISAEGYRTPTPIQAEAIPAMLAGRDILGIAQTGTGKTAAFVLPLLDRIARRRARPGARSCGALILAPTRELAAQIADNIRTYGRFLRPSVAVVVGGVKPGPQIRALAPGVDIVVATPGRLLDHLSSGVIRLDRTTAVVLDEGDQMLDLGFAPAIRRIMNRLPANRQTVLMSATMPRPIRALARDYQSDPVTIAVTPAATPIARIDQRVMHVDRAGKRRVLTALLADPAVERAIVFTRTKRGADKVNRYLQMAGLSAAAIHGNKSQGQRERVLAAFRSGHTTILVATDIAARGIDVDDISHIVNYELPNVAESYVHRIGRTARAGRAGIAVTLCDPAERGLLRDIERLIGNTLDRHAISLEASRPVPGEPEPAAAPPKKTGGKRHGRARSAQQTQATVRSNRKQAHHADAPAPGPARRPGRIGPERTGGDAAVAVAAAAV